MWISDCAKNLTFWVFFFCQTVGEKSSAEHVLYLDELVSDEQEGGGEEEEGRDQEAVHEGIIGK